MCVHLRYNARECGNTAVPGEFCGTYRRITFSPARRTTWNSERSSLLGWLRPLKQPLELPVGLVIALNLAIALCDHPRCQVWQGARTALQRSGEMTSIYCHNLTGQMTARPWTCQIQGSVSRGAVDGGAGPGCMKGGRASETTATSYMPRRSRPCAHQQEWRADQRGGTAFAVDGPYPRQRRPCLPSRNFDGPAFQESALS